MATKPGKPNRSRPPRAEPISERRKTSPPPPRARPNDARPARAPSAESSQPEITLHRSTAGRETLAAIADEVANGAPTSTRPRLDTLGYEERPRPPSRPSQSSSPEVISIDETPVGRATQAAIEDALLAETLATIHPAQKGPAALPRPAPANVFEISTFVVEGDEIFTKASEQSRRDFVAERLLHRLPALSMNEVVRIDLSRGAAPNTVILRVWSKVGRPPKP